MAQGESVEVMVSEGGWAEGASAEEAWVVVGPVTEAVAWVVDCIH